MEMHQARYFFAVARQLNFTRAAEECHVAQPSLTRAIKLLEEELGGELFRRERNLSHLADLGRGHRGSLSCARKRPCVGTNGARQHADNGAHDNILVQCWVSDEPDVDRVCDPDGWDTLNTFEPIANKAV